MTSLGLLLFKLDQTLRSSNVEIFRFPLTTIQPIIACVHNPNNPCKEIVVFKMECLVWFAESEHSNSGILASWEVVFSIYLCEMFIHKFESFWDLETASSWNYTVACRARATSHSTSAENKRVKLTSRSLEIHLLMYVYNNVKINGPSTLLKCSPIMEKYVMQRCFNSYTLVTILVLNGLVLVTDKKLFTEHKGLMASMWTNWVMLSTFISSFALSLDWT